LIPSANTSHMDGGTCSDSLSRVSSSFTHPLSCFILFFFFSFALFPSGALCLARVWLYAQHCSGSAVWIRCACACGCGEGSGFSSKAPLCCPPVSGDYKRIREPRPWLHPQNQWPNGNYAPGRPTFDFPCRDLLLVIATRLLGGPWLSGVTASRDGEANLFLLDGLWLNINRHVYTHLIK
jgi:hypothetical protein